MFSEQVSLVSPILTGTSDMWTKITSDIYMYYCMYARGFMYSHTLLTFNSLASLLLRPPHKLPTEGWSSVLPGFPLMHIGTEHLAQVLDLDPSLKSPLVCHPLLDTLLYINWSELQSLQRSQPSLHATHARLRTSVETESMHFGYKWMFATWRGKSWPWIITGNHSLVFCILLRHLPSVLKLADWLAVCL